jgi:hypothetical protein
MACRVCESTNQQFVPTEIAFHAPSRVSFNVPHLLSYPQVLVCFNCGLAEFSVAEEMLREMEGLKRTA